MFEKVCDEETGIAAPDPQSPPAVVHDIGSPLSVLAFHEIVTEPPVLTEEDDGESVRDTAACATEDKKRKKNAEAKTPRKVFRM